MPENFRAPFTVHSVAGRSPFLASMGHAAAVEVRVRVSRYAWSSLER
jgi:hypothetical protein